MPNQPPEPKCKAILLCEKVIIEVVTGKPSLISVLDSFQVQQFPSRIRPFFVFLQITDAEGRYEVTVEVEDLSNGTAISRSPGLPVDVSNRLVKTQVSIQVPPLPVQHEGTYDVVVYANGLEIDRQPFQVRGP